MKRISNFIFTEGYSKNDAPKPIAININHIVTMGDIRIDGESISSIKLSSGDIIHLTGNHEDNMIDFAKAICEDTLDEITFHETAGEFNWDNWDEQKEV